MIKTSSAIVLFSGGLDSLVHLYWANERFRSVRTLTVDFGQAYAEKEKAAVSNCLDSFVRKTWQPYGRLRPSPLADPIFVDATQLQLPMHGTDFIPLRNLYLLQLATKYSNNIVFGMLEGEQPPDKNPRFVRRYQRELNLQLFGSPEYQPLHDGIKIWTPFAKQTKTQMVKWFMYDSVRRNFIGGEHLIRQSVSCFSGGKHPCGECSSCFNRWVALTNCGIEEVYETPVWTWGIWRFLHHGPSPAKYKWPVKYLWTRRRWLRDCIRAYNCLRWKSWASASHHIHRED